jgi:hypothetical protein
VIQVGDSEVKVSTVTTDMVVVSVDGGPSQVVTDQKKTLLLPEVYASVGIGPSGVGGRLLFEAPREIRILRKEMSAP